MYPQMPLPAQVPADANEEGDGIVIGDGPVTTDSYIDFQCPFCRMFEEASGPMLDGMVADGRITLIYHPMAFLDAMSTNRYSTRASAASGCASDGGKFSEYLYTLFANQPSEGGPGLSDEELIALGLQIGLTDAFAGCVRGGVHLDWPPYVTARAAERGVSTTPTVLVEGVVVRPHPGLIQTAVSAALHSGV
ncbi:thioredoxin domain-containing protein [Streptomyces sp. NPDC005355]|uniref:DsbA family protein n=1 Tax=Streptomyces sp. NPDC005355 TaxID=3157038 RepID=UPI0033AF11FF